MNKTRIEEIRHLISKYFEREYDETLSKEELYDNINDLGLAYTTTEEDWEEFTDDEIHDIQVSTDIESMTLQTYLDGTLLENYKFSSYDSYKMFLESLDFDEMIGDAHDVIRKWKEIHAI